VLQAVADQARTAECTAPIEPLTFRWVIDPATCCTRGVGVADSMQVPVPGDGNLTAFVGRNPAVLTLPRLRVGGVYRLSVVVAFAARPTVSNSASVTVVVSSSGVSATIVGGDRDVGLLLPWDLDARPSTDNDQLDIQADPLRFSWACATRTTSSTSGVAVTTETAGCRDPASGQPMQLPAVALLSMAAQALPVGSYRFTVTVSKGAVGSAVPLHFRSATASVVVNVVFGNPPGLVAAVSQLSVNPQGSARVSVAVDGRGARDVALQWSSPDLTPASLLAVLESPVTSAFLVVRLCSTWQSVSPGHKRPPRGRL
jgi:hypothetical protein